MKEERNPLHGRPSQSQVYFLGGGNEEEVLPDKFLSEGGSGRHSRKNKRRIGFKSKSQVVSLGTLKF